MFAATLIAVIGELNRMVNGRILFLLPLQALQRLDRVVCECSATLMVKMLVQRQLALLSFEQEASLDSHSQILSPVHASKMGETF